MRALVAPATQALVALHTKAPAALHTEGLAVPATRALGALSTVGLAARPIEIPAGLGMSALAVPHMTVLEVLRIRGQAVPAMTVPVAHATQGRGGQAGTVRRYARAVRCTLLKDRHPRSRPMGAAKYSGCSMTLHRKSLYSRATMRCKRSCLRRAILSGLGSWFPRHLRIGSPPGHQHSRSAVSRPSMPGIE